MATIKYAADYTDIRELVEFWETHPFGDDREPVAEKSAAAKTETVPVAVTEHAAPASLAAYTKTDLKKAAARFRSPFASEVKKIHDGYNLFDYRRCRFSSSAIYMLYSAKDENGSENGDAANVMTNVAIIEKNGVPIIEGFDDSATENVSENVYRMDEAQINNDFKNLVDSVLI
ncbi:MAG: hypothetical protein Ta2A_06070 [Treponemataceae bacterium]|nr:MAG: hypothetical protein Ta2A_06070 [Treponemataceae bacterium]